MWPAPWQRMSDADFQVRSRRLVADFWRTKAALAFLRNTVLGRAGDISTLVYHGLPSVPGEPPLLQSEHVTDAVDALLAHHRDRLSHTVFLGLIALIEERIIEKLSDAGLATDETLGTIQTRVQQQVAVSHELRVALNEIRTRRNCLIHDHGTANQKLTDAIAALVGPAAVMVPRELAGQPLSIAGEYLVYCQHVLARYSTCLT